MTKKISRIDGLVLIFLTIILLFGMTAVLVYEDNRTAFSDSDQWFHWLFLLSGLLMVVAFIIRFIPLIAITTIPGGIRSLLGCEEFVFPNQTRFYSWLVVFLLGLSIVVYEFKLENEWYSQKKTPVVTYQR